MIQISWCRVWFPLLAIALLLENPALPQKSHSGNRASQKGNKVSLRVRLSRDKFHPGSDALAALIVEIQQGWHINSSTPADENFIETSLQVKVPKRIGIAHIRYPKGIERNFDFAESPLNVYEGTINILLELKLASDLKPGSYTIPLLLGYQACSDRVCLAPTTLPADLRLEVVGADKKTLRINKDLFDGSEEVQKP